MFTKLILSINKVLGLFEPVANLLIRGYVSYQFFISGLTKFDGFADGSTLMLFTHEYSVPILTPFIAAILATAMELILPVFQR